MREEVGASGRACEGESGARAWSGFGGRKTEGECRESEGRWRESVGEGERQTGVAGWEATGEW